MASISKRQLWIGVSILAVGAAVLIGGQYYPPHGGQTAGTIVPVERYRSEQISNSDLKLGGSNVSGPSQAGSNVTAGQAAAAAGQAAGQSAAQAAGQSAAQAAGQSAAQAAGQSAAQAAGQSAAQAAGQSAAQAAGQSAAAAAQAAAAAGQAAGQAH